MSAPGNALRAAGLRVVDRPVPGRPGPFGPLKGIVLHHTAGKAPGDRTVVTRGRADLPGPLAQFYVEPDGTWHVITVKRANHAGVGQALGLPPNTGNRHLLGVEVSTPGTAITGKQYEAVIAGLAALCRHYGWTPARIVGHKEYAPGRKNDPINNMTTVRADVARRLSGRPKLPAYPGWERLRAGSTHPFVKVVQVALGRQVTGRMSASDLQAVKTYRLKRPPLWPPRAAVGPLTARWLAANPRVKARWRR